MPGYSELSLIARAINLSACAKCVISLHKFLYVAESLSGPDRETLGITKDLVIQRRVAHSCVACGRQT